MGGAMSDERPTYWECVGAVTIKQAAKDIAFFFGLWVFGCVIGFMADAYVPDVTFLDNVPKQVWWMLFIASLTFSWRGEKVNFVWPKSLWSWFFINLYFAFMLFLGSLEKGAVSGYLIWALFCTFGLLNSLEEKGRENIEDQAELGRVGHG